MAKKKIPTLTDKQRRFCEEYVRDWNGTRAALAAGFSKKTAGQIAYDMLRKPHIQAYIEEVQENLAQLAGISKLKNLEELKKIAYSSIAHLHDSWIELKEFEKLTDDQKACIEGIDTKTETKTSKKGELILVEYVKIKLYSKTKALEMINNMMGWNAPTKQEIDHKNNGKGFKPEKTTIVFKKKT